MYINDEAFKDKAIIFARLWKDLLPDHQTQNFSVNMHMEVIYYTTLASVINPAFVQLQSNDFSDADKDKYWYLHLRWSKSDTG